MVPKHITHIPAYLTRLGSLFYFDLWLHEGGAGGGSRADQPRRLLLAKLFLMDPHPPLARRSAVRSSGSGGGGLVSAVLTAQVWSLSSL